MIGRRALLQAFGGSAGLAAVGGRQIHLHEVEKAVSGAQGVGVGCTPLPDHYPFNPYRVIAQLRRRQEERYAIDPARMPADIASKRSWSPAFKETVALERVRELEQMIHALEVDERMAERVAKALFGPKE